MIIKLGFGLDLSGYSTGRSQLFAATLAGNVCELVLLKHSPFSAIVKGKQRVDHIIEREVECIRRMLALGKVAVDVPIDLQKLGIQDNVTFAWELTYRSIDKALNALAPMADRIGSPVARFRQILAKGQLFHQLGNNLFETYPAASLKGLGCTYRGYKGNGLSSRSARSEIAQLLGIDNWQWDDDKLDAAICSLTAIHHPSSIIDGDTLLKQRRTELVQKLGTSDVQAPKGFVLLNCLPEARLLLSECDCEKWLAKHELSA